MSIITGLFKSPREAAAAVHVLEARGFSHESISLVASESFNRESFAVDTHSKLPEGVALGGSAGAAIGALVAGLTTIGTIASGGAGLLVAGPLVSALAGAGAGVAGGGIIGGLIGLGIPEHEVKHYEQAIGRGAVLVGVQCGSEDEKARARKALDDADAERISTA